MLTESKHLEYIVILNNYIGSKPMYIICGDSILYFEIIEGINPEFRLIRQSIGCGIIDLSNVQGSCTVYEYTEGVYNVFSTGVFIGACTINEVLHIADTIYVEKQIVATTFGR